MAHRSSRCIAEKTTVAAEGPVELRGCVATTGRVRAPAASWGLCSRSCQVLPAPSAMESHTARKDERQKTHPVSHRADNSALLGTKTKVSF